jgi:pimeloyl-ACP methyl ester carboxylesterase
MAVASLDLELDVFAGPFDLLLAVVLREEISLLEVDLSDIVLAYIEHLEREDELDLEVATEFLVLIASLLELKSRLLLPGAEELGEVGPEEAAERFVRRMIGDERWERLPSRTRAERRSEGPALLAELGSIRSGPPYDPATLSVPVLAGHGSTSKLYHQEAAVRLAQWAPDGELVVIDGAGHAAQSSHPDEFAAFVRRAVARQG